MPFFRRLAAYTGYGSLLATGTWLGYTRKCAFGPLDQKDYLFHSTVMARLNPDNHPGMSDQCIREVPLSKLRDDLRNNDGKLVEQFTASVWGGIGMWKELLFPYFGAKWNKQGSRRNEQFLNTTTTMTRQRIISGQNKNLLHHLTIKKQK